MEDEVLQRERKIERLERELTRQKQVIEKIDRAIGSLPELERSVMEMKYLSGERVFWVQVAERVGYLVDHCKGYVRKRVIRRIAVAIFGLVDLDSFDPLPLFNCG